MREFKYVFAAIALIFTVIAVRVDAAIVPVAHPKWLEDEFSHSEELDKKDPQLALNYLTNVVAENPNLAGYDLAFAYAHLARYASFVGLLDKTLNYVELAKAAYPNYTEHLAIELLLSESFVLDAQGQSDKSLTLLLEAEKIAIEIEDSQAALNVYNTIANAYSLNYEDVKALQYFQKAYVEVQKLGDARQQALLNINMANSYNFLKDHEKALELTVNSVEYFAQNEMPYDEMAGLYVMALSLQQLERYDEAKLHYRKVSQLAEQLDNQVYKYYSYSGLTYTNLLDKNLAQAQQYFALAQKNYWQSSEVFLQLNHLSIEMELCINNGEMERAAQLKDELQVLFETVPVQQNYGWAEKLAKLFALYYATTGEHIKAYEEMNKAYEMLKKGNSVVREQARSRFKVMFDTERTELAVRLMENEKNTKQLALEKAIADKQLQWMIIVLFAVITFIFVLFWYRQIRMSKKFYLLANRDTLTGVANRRAVLKFAEKRAQLCKNTYDHLCFVIFDIDHFKQINDNYGHPAGDEVLKKVAQQVTSHVRENDKFGRIGGEEFLLVIEGSLAVAESLAERMRESLAQMLIEYDNKTIKLTASFGVAACSDPKQTVDQLLQQADEALYQAKQGGRNQVVVVT